MRIVDIPSNHYDLDSEVGRSTALVATEQLRSEGVSNMVVGGVAGAIVAAVGEFKFSELPESVQASAELGVAVGAGVVAFLGLKYVVESFISNRRIQSHQIAEAV